MLKNEELLLALVVKNKGDWNKTYNDLTKKDFPDEEYVEKVAKEYQGQYITILDNEYPEQLKQGLKPPFVLFYEGNIKALKDKNYTRLALSDSKHVSATDIQIAKEILSNVPDTTLILGGEGQLTDDIVKNTDNPIIIVLAYSPKQYGYVGLKQKVINQGGVIISEYPNNAFIELSNEHFMNRYRIMSSLCDKVLIINNIKKTSGTNVLVMFALQQGKDIMVVPVSPLETESANNKLIYEGAIPVYNNLVLCDNLR